MNLKRSDWVLMFIALVVVRYGVSMMPMPGKTQGNWLAFLAALPALGGLATFVASVICSLAVAFGKGRRVRSETLLAARPLVCFGCVAVGGIAGFALTRNGQYFFSFLLAYVLNGLIASVIGAVWATRTFAGLPGKHWGRLALTASILLAGLPLAVACFWVLLLFNFPIA